MDKMSNHMDFLVKRKCVEIIHDDGCGCAIGWG